MKACRDLTPRAAWFKTQVPLHISFTLKFHYLIENPLPTATNVESCQTKKNTNTLKRYRLTSSCITALTQICLLVYQVLSFIKLLLTDK